MPEENKDMENVQIICDVYKKLPDYLKGKIDGYAEAIKQNRAENAPQ